jgi:ATP-dependent helicase HrpB
MSTLPIEQILPTLLSLLSQNSAVVVQAPPGAGKTTRIPLALMKQEWLAGQKILMLQPRRIAARHAAEHMAFQLGEAVGQRIGFSVRFERQHSEQTQIEVVTEGILTRRLQTDPELKGVGLVIFDEIHERNIHSDLALALCRDAQQSIRSDLKLLVMSATLDAEPIAKVLDDCPVLTSSGHCYPVDTRYLPQTEKISIAQAVANGIKTALNETDSDILAFLPGSREIHQCAELLASLSHIDIRPLFGGLNINQQRLAIAPGSKRRVVLATNIAETSLTINGISAVVDSGWERRPRFDLSSSVTRLELKRISLASATQRQGRAGRLGPGICYRLWSQGQQAELLPQAPAEIRNADLAPLVLELACWGESNPHRLCWIDPPSPNHLKQAKNLLQELGALDQEGRATSLGRQMICLPLPPRLSRFVIAAQNDGYGALACELATLLNERDLLPRSATKQRSECDLHTRWLHYKHQITSPDTQSVQRLIKDLKRIIKVSGDSWWPTNVEFVQAWLTQAWPDRIARQRDPESKRYLFSDGSGATLSARSGLQQPPFLVAISLEQRLKENEIVVASTIHQASLEAIFSQRLKPQRQICWDEKTERVQAKEIVALGAIILSERPLKASREEQIAGAIAGVRQIGIERLNWTRDALQLRARIKRCATERPKDGWPDVSFSHLTDQLESWLAPFLSGVTTRSNLESFDPTEALKSRMTWDQQQRLNQLTPERILVPSGSHIRIDYNVDGPPLLAVKLQELFGLKHNPTILENRVPLLIHLLSPAGRPLAVTQDLEHFWNHTYPQVRKEMRGRYPKHPWPEDPWNASATARTKKRMDIKS